MSMIPTYSTTPAGRRATEEKKDSRPVPLQSGISMLETLQAASADVHCDPMQRQSSRLSDEGAKSRRSGRCGGTTLTARKSGTAAVANDNMFAVLMEATKYCSLGQLTEAMFEVGGQYRRNM